MSKSISIFYPLLTRRNPYKGGKKYTDYRMEICEDCQHRCAYCDIHENQAGGYESMHLDHFRPHTKFPDLKHNPKNLIWACNRCNLLKSNDWHDIEISQIHSMNIGYIDPFEVDRTNFFNVDRNGLLIAISGPAGYMIERLKLNRNFLIKIRRTRQVYQMIEQRVQEITAPFDERIAEAIDLLAKNVIDETEYRRRIQRELDQKENFLNIIASLLPEYNT